jgi:hypothetical protein
VSLTGINSSSNRVVEGQKMQRELRRCSEGILLQLLAVELGVEQQCSDIGDPDL